MRTIIRDNYTPKAGDYHERIVRDEVNNRQWIFDCDGVFTDITDTNTEIEIVNELGSSTTAVTSQKLVTDNVGILQEKIDELKNSPDVVDIVATYEDLMDYDTSSLGDKDVIRVLVDETHDNESSYYRWDKTNSQWVFIGAVEGYYTKAQTDDLLDEKQDTLTAGSNIQISGSTISATDTTYTAGNGLDLTGTTFSADTTVLATQADLATKQGTLTAGANISIDSNNVISATDTTYTAGTGLDLADTTFSVDTTTIQEKLTAGTNVSISGNTISATDTTYSDFVGTDGTAAGTAGLVPAPATTDADKFLKADGTWDTAGGEGGTGAKILTADDYNWNSTAGDSTTEPFDCIAMWLLEPGVYATADDTVLVKYQKAQTAGPSTLLDIISNSISGLKPIMRVSLSNSKMALSLHTMATNGSSFNTSVSNVAGLVASVYGTSTTEAPSQIAVRNALTYPTNSNTVRIGAGAQSNAVIGNESVLIGRNTGSYNLGQRSILIGNGGPAQNNNDSVSIGSPAYANYRCVVIGSQASTSGQQQVAIGYGANASLHAGAVALGSGAVATVKGQVQIGSNSTSYGYNNSNYRLLSGLYDPQSAHDAATKGYVDTAVAGAGGANTISSQDWSDLWQ